MVDRGGPLNRKLAAARQRFAARIGDRIGAIEAALAGLRAADGPEDVAIALDALIFPVHRLAGSAATFGFAETGRAAAELEGLLVGIKDAGREPSSGEWEGISTLVDRLGRTAAGPDGVPSPAASADGVPSPAASADGVPSGEGSGTGESSLVFLVGDDPELARDTASQLGHFGYRVRTFGGASGLARAIRETPPEALILDVMLGEGPMAGIEALDGLRRAGVTPPPAIVVSSRDDLPTRLAAVRAGALGYFNKPVDVALVAETLDRLTKTVEIEPYRILIVEDDRDLAEYYASLMEPPGMTTCIVTDPMGVMEPLREFRPELILMDINMPGCDGIELAGVIRQSEDFVQIPIVFLTAEKSHHRRLSALRAGGDDFLPKPIRPDLLLSSVVSRCQRSRLLGSMISRDSMTGLANHGKIEEHLETELKRAKREDRPLAFAMIDIDRFKSVNDTYGHWTGDVVIKALAQILRQRLRKTDIVGRYGGEEFAAILPNTDSGAAFGVLDGIRDGFGRIRHLAGDDTFHVTFSCGIAAYPALDTPTLLNRRADQALYEAKEKGRDRVVQAAASGCEPPRTAVDSPAR